MKTSLRITASLAVLATVGVFAFFIVGARPASPEQTGWCCLRAGSSCDRGYNAPLCLDSGGRVFSAEAQSCADACRTLPSDGEE